MSSASCTPHVQNYHVLNWLITVPVKVLLTENWQINISVWPPLLWQKNRKMTGLSVITSYLWLKFIFVLVWINLIYWLVLSLMKINYDSNDQNNCVMRRISFVVLIWSKNNVELNCILSLTRINWAYRIILGGWCDETYFVTEMVK